MRHLPDFIQTALTAPQQQQTSNQLAKPLAHLLGLAITYHPKQEYCAGWYYSFQTRIKKTNASPRSKGSLFEIRIYISSRAPIFTFYCFDHQYFLTKKGKLNHPIPLTELPETLLKPINLARGLLEQHDYQEVHFDWLTQPAPHCLTEIDAQPANVFEVLFAEIV